MEALLRCKQYLNLTVTLMEALLRCKQQMKNLEAKGMSHLESYSKVKDRFEQMKRNRRDLDVLMSRSDDLYS